MILEWGGDWIKWGVRLWLWRRREKTGSQETSVLASSTSSIADDLLPRFLKVFLLQLPWHTRSCSTSSSSHEFFCLHWTFFMSPLRCGCPVEFSFSSLPPAPLVPQSCLLPVGCSQHLSISGRTWFLPWALVPDFLAPVPLRGTC